MVTCTQGDKEMKIILGASDFTPEDLAEIPNNPTMEANVSMVCGGITKATITIPLWQYLTGWEKRRIKRAIYQHNSGDLATLAAENDGVTNLNKIIRNVHEKALEIPREKRTTRNGLRYGTWNDNQGNQPRHAGISETERQT